MPDSLPLARRVADLIQVGEGRGSPCQLYFGQISTRLVFDWQRVEQRTPVRIGQKNKITRRWARRGTRPSAPQDQRTASTYIFGAICPETGVAAGLVLPWCNTEAMGLHLTEIAARVTPGKHCALLVDQAGWHTSERLAVPSNITLLPLPAKCPELNPVENVWQFMRDNWLSNRVFRSYDAIVDHCCYA